MVIKGKINQKTVKKEIDYIIDIIKKYQNKWNKEKTVIINKNTIEDNTLIEIFKHNEDLGEINFIENLKELENNMLLINTDTFMKAATRINHLKTNFTINVFADYSQADLKQILKYYDINNKEYEPTQYNISDELLEAYEKYLYGDFDLTHISPELRKELTNFLQEKNQKTNITIVNSYTADKILKV